jgi:hypothetical protein
MPTSRAGPGPPSGPVRARTTKLKSARKRERPGCNPVSHHIGAVSAERESLCRSLVGLQTDLKPARHFCALLPRLSVSASAHVLGAGDGLQPDHHSDSGELRMSHASIAAALMLDDLSPSERLVAFSLASYANRENVAWPGNPAAATRAGLSRSRYLHARDLLARRGLIGVADRGGGRGRSTTIALAFADQGPWFDGDINAELFEAVLSCSPVRGSTRLMLGAMAAIANSEREVSVITTDEIRGGAGLADSTYRRARTSLLESGDLVLERGGGGRGKTNVWRIRDPHELAHQPARLLTRRAAPMPGARPLVAALPAPAVAANPAQSRTVSVVKGAQTRTVSAAETPPQTPPETPPPNVRARREPQNPKTNPPHPPEGGNRPDIVLVQENYRTDRGRQRQRTVRVDLAEVRRRLGIPSVDNLEQWQQIRRGMAAAVGDSTFEIWLAPLELIAIDSTTNALVLSGPAQTLAWVERRYGRLITRAAEHIGREVRIAVDIERQAITG